MQAWPDGWYANIHGGGFVMGAGSIAEAVPFAYLTGAPIYCIDYRLAPEHPYPAAVEDCIAAYGAILERHPGVPIGLYGSSAGASLVFQLLHDLRARELPLPGAIGPFSPPADLSDFGDSGRLFTMTGLWGNLHLELDHEWSEVRAYLGGLDPKNPRVSPVYGDLRAYPPALLVSGTRDILLSGTTRLHRRLVDAKVAAELIVFEGMPHCHWFTFHLPEAEEFLSRAVEFFDRHLKVDDHRRSVS